MIEVRVEEEKIREFFSEKEWTKEEIDRLRERIGREQEVIRALQRRYMHGAKAEVEEPEEENGLVWFREELHGNYSEISKRAGLKALAESLVRNGYDKDAIVTFFHGRLKKKEGFSPMYCWFVGVRVREGSERL